MKVYDYVPLHDFEFWCGAEATAKLLMKEEFDLIEEYLEELYPNGMHEIDVNDFFWFEDEWIANFLGYESYEELFNERKKPF